ncbi:MAG: class I SAM-dependent methyltransferase [Planctomycetia bacterium]|nr:class I SAM-dependent methyltransferase [Planctomycetia bacterium]
MNPAEYETMARVEATHWWYCGLRDIIVKTLRQRRFAIPPNANVLDAGCGTGENLKLLRDLLTPAYLGGFDASSQALRFASEKVPEADVYCSDIRDPAIHVESLDLLMSCELINHAGLADSLGGLNRLTSRLRSGGLFLIDVPAYQWMLSEHDIAVHGRERYVARQVRDLLDQTGLSVEILTYRMFVFFPMIVLCRLPTILGPKPHPDAAKSDTKLPGSLINSALKAILAVENSLIDCGLRFPWGTSIFAVARKP